MELCECNLCGKVHEKKDIRSKQKVYRWVVKNYHGQLEVSEEYYDRNAKRWSHDGKTILSPRWVPVEKISCTEKEIDADEIELL